VTMIPRSGLHALLFSSQKQPFGQAGGGLASVPGGHAHSSAAPRAAPFGDGASVDGASGGGLEEQAQRMAVHRHTSVSLSMLGMMVLL
jgi:hypothetical protein